MRIDVKTTIKRLKAVLEIKTDEELAELCFVTKHTVANWKRRNTFNYAAIIELSMQNKISLDWLFGGKPIKITIEKG